MISPIVLLTNCKDFVSMDQGPQLTISNPSCKQGSHTPGRVPLTSLAMVVMKAGGLAVAMRERACRAERAESAAGLRGSPIVMLNRDGGKRRQKEKEH